MRRGTSREFDTRHVTLFEEQSPIQNPEPRGLQISAKVRDFELGAGGKFLLVSESKGQVGTVRILDLQTGRSSSPKAKFEDTRATWVSGKTLRIWSKDFHDLMSGADASAVRRQGQLVRADLPDVKSEAFGYDRAAVFPGKSEGEALVFDNGQVQEYGNDLRPRSRWVLDTRLKKAGVFLIARHGSGLLVLGERESWLYTENKRRVLRRLKKTSTYRQAFWLATERSALVLDERYFYWVDQVTDRQKLARVEELTLFDPFTGTSNVVAKVVTYLDYGDNPDQSRMTVRSNGGGLEGVVVTLRPTNLHPVLKVCRIDPRLKKLRLVWSRQSSSDAIVSAVASEH
ncbi:MAG: hypothetical protein KF884_07170 [Fimbriimonadaceae bacterium]|nr:hypothetical protein [Fimbriimonadaceae bacterium]QYK57330.1 MAG: hypothetical protein KF884_07170 [Fimbriimonadaceae bacterium]